MEKRIGNCPVCGGKMMTHALYCSQCNMEIVHDFPLSPFDYLEETEVQTLFAFLRHRGNLKGMQQELGISYPTAKKRLEMLLQALHLTEDEESTKLTQEDLENLLALPQSYLPSALIRTKMAQAGGSVQVHSLEGSTYLVSLTKDGKIVSPAIGTYDLRVFDLMVDLLIAEGGTAKKGQARGKEDKLGSVHCNEHTLTGVIAAKYHGKKTGDAVFDPVFLLAAVLEWAGIAHNRRGTVELQESYWKMIYGE